MLRRIDELPHLSPRTVLLKLRNERHFREKSEHPIQPLTTLGEASTNAASGTNIKLYALG